MIDDYKVENTRRWGRVAVLPGIDEEIAAALARAADRTEEVESGEGDD